MGPDFFLYPEAVPFLLLAPFVWGALWVKDRLRMRRFTRIAGPRRSTLAAEISSGRRGARRWLLAAIVFGIVFALLQPLGREDGSALDQRGVDVVVCLDVSRSMLAGDVAPSRLEFARREIRDLVLQNPGDRFGLILFAGEAELTVPLTQDGMSFNGLLDLADPLSLKRGGTDVGMALSRALEVFDGKSGDHEVVMLITDGEDLEDKGLAVASTCRERGITVHCVGIGSPKGSKIAVAAEEGEEFLRNRDGEEVVSVLDREGLAAIADAAGGQFVDASLRPRPLELLYEKRIRPMARKAFEEERRRERRNHYQWPLLAAISLWSFELGLSERKRGRTRGN